jgi:O-antigen/teichoic acid export membrane protein
MSVEAVKRDPKEPADTGKLREAARSGLFWFTGVSVFQDVLQFGVMLVLVRLLEPKAYGQSALITSIVGFLMLFSYRYFIEQTLQARPQEHVDYQTHFAASGAVQVGTFLLANLVAAGMRYFDTYKETAPLLHVMSVVFLLDWPSELRVKMLERQLNWRRLRILQAAGMMLNAAAALLMAAGGAGVYALLLPGLLAMTPFVWDLFVTAKWRPTWAWKRDALPPVIRYGVVRILTLSLVGVRQLAESAILARSIGLSTLGVYSRAFGLANIACGHVPFFLTASIYPVLTRLPAGSERFKKAAAMTFRAVAWFAVPAMVWFAFESAPIVQLLYGSKWLAVVPLLPLALAHAALGALIRAANILLLGSYQQSGILLADTAGFVGAGLSLILLLPHGILYYLGGAVVAQALSLSVMLHCLHSAGVVSLREWGDSIWPAFVGTAVALTLSYLVKAVPGPAAEGIPRFFLMSVFFSFSYIAAVRCIAPAAAAELVDLAPGTQRLRRILWYPAAGA